MLEKLRPRSIYDIMAAIACLGALVGGTAYAANTIGSSDVINESLLSEDIKNETVAGHDIKPSTIGSGRIADSTIQGLDVMPNTIGSTRIVDNAVNSIDVKNDGLTGDDVNESSLGTVPNASAVGPSGVNTDALQNGAVTRAKRELPEVWHYIGDPGEPAFLNGWSNYDASATHGGATYQHAAFMKDNEGTVHIRGLVKGGTIGQPFFNLSHTYCPWFFHAFPAISNDAFARITVQFVQPHCGVYAQSGSNIWVSLEGVSYPEWPLEQRVRTASDGGVGATATSPDGKRLVRSTR